jgi:predicted amidohydrolase
MNLLNIALLQLAGHGADRAANLATGDACCRRAAALGADLALFPEMWSIAYTFDRPPVAAPVMGAADPSWLDPTITDLWRCPAAWAGASDPYTPELQEAIRAWQALAEPRDGPFVTHFRRLARELDMAIAITYLEAWPGAPRNTVSLIDRHGEIVLTYAKVHTCAFDLPEAALTPGDDFYVTPLDTARGPVQIGAMICYDREFPESARILMLKGAEIILIPNACDLEINRLAQCRTRAYENMVGLALANYACPATGLRSQDPSTWGHSIAFDGIAFARGRSRDMLIVEAGEAEGIYLAPCDLDALREYRQREAWGNAFRRPSRYALLSSPEVAEPFVRVDVHGEAFNG